jgi:hypothetical protein
MQSHSIYDCSIDPGGTYALFGSSIPHGGGRGKLAKLMLTDTNPTARIEITGAQDARLALPASGPPGQPSYYTSRIMSVAIAPDGTYALIGHDNGSKGPPIRKVMLDTFEVIELPAFAWDGNSGTGARNWRPIGGYPDISSISFSSSGSWILFTNRARGGVYTFSFEDNNIQMVAGDGPTLSGKEAAINGNGNEASFGSAAGCALMPDASYALVVSGKNSISKITPQ